MGMARFARYCGILFLIPVIFISGCGYTTRSLLPENYKSICVENFANKINLSAEQSDMRMYRGYRPGMEIDLTKAVIDRFLNDGNLKIAPQERTDLVLKGELVDFRREALAYDNNENIDEYRLKLIVNIELRDAGTGKTLWTEKNFSGETNYRTSGSLAQSETAAVKNATLDMARRIVERTVEAW